MNSSRHTIIGLGGFGRQKISYLIKNSKLETNLCFINTPCEDDKAILPNQKFKPYPPLKELCIFKQLADLSTAEATLVDIDNSNELNRNLYSELKSIAQFTDTLYLVTGLGGQLGTMIFPTIMQYAAELKLKTHAIVTLPFHFEENRLTKTEALLKTIHDLQFQNLITINNALISQVKSFNGSLGDYSDILDKITLFLIEALIKDGQAISGSNWIEEQFIESGIDLNLSKLINIYPVF